MKLRDNPLVTYEFRQTLRSLNRLGSTRSAQALVLGASALLYGWALWAWHHTILPGDRGELTGACAVTVVALLCFLGPLGAAGLIAGDRQKGTWDLLVTTTLTPRDIVLGKFWSRVLGCAFMGGLLAPFLALGTPQFEDTAAVVAAWLVVTSTSLCGLVALGLACSAGCRTAAAARTVALLVTFALLVGPWLCGWEHVALVTCPPATLVGLALLTEPDALALHCTVQLALLGPVLYAGLTWGCLWLVLHKFDTWLRWDSGAGRRA